MITAVSISLLVYILVCVTVLGFTHVLVCRSKVATRFASPQVSLAWLILLLNAPLLAGAEIIAWFEGRPPVEGVSMLVFSSIVYNGIAYAYFHVFNMSETARRIHILLHVLTHNDVNAENLSENYLPRSMASVRLDRLEKMGQIVRGTDGRFRIDRKLLLFAARVIRVCRQILRLERKNIA